MSHYDQKINRTIVLVFYGLTAIGILLHFKMNFMFGLDDSYITFRYAQNLADGYGLRFNVDEKYFGSTAMGFAILLGVVSHAIDVITHHSFIIKEQIADSGIWIPVVANFLSAVSMGVIVVVLYKIGNAILGLKIGFAVAVFFGVFIFVSPISERVSGHETNMHLAILFVSLYLLYFTNGFFISGLVLGLSVTLRPDSYLMFLIMVSILAIRCFVSQPRSVAMRLAASFASGFLALVIPWLIFCAVYFGQILPGTLDAKRAQTLLGDFPLYTVDIVANETLLFFGWHVLSLFVVSILSAIALLVLQNRSATALLGNPSFCIIASLLLFAGGQVVFYWWMKVSFWWWYLHPVWFMGMMASIVSIVNLLAYGLAPGWAKIWSASALWVVCILGILASNMGDSLGRWFHPWLRGQRTRWEHPYSYDPIVRYLKEKEPAGTTVATAEPGALAFKLGPAFKVIDELGLASPRVAKKLVEGDMKYIFTTWSPEYVIATWDGHYTAHKTDWFNREYELIGEFDRQDYWKERMHHGAYLFKKRAQLQQDRQ